MSGIDGHVAPPLNQGHELGDVLLREEALRPTADGQCRHIDPGQRLRPVGGGLVDLGADLLDHGPVEVEVEVALRTCRRCRGPGMGHTDVLEQRADARCSRKMDFT